MDTEATFSSNTALDLQIVEEFFADYGSSAPDLVQVFLDDTEMRLERMRRLAGARRREELALDAHSLKSSALAFGLTSLAVRAARMQRDLDRAWTDTAPVETELLLAAFKEGGDQLRDFVARRQR